MLKRAAVFIAFLANACVTVNIFSAAAVERAADEIVKETWEAGRSRLPKSNRGACFQQQGRSYPSVYRRSCPRSRHQYFQPAIRALKDSIKNRSGSIVPLWIAVMWV